MIVSLIKTNQIFSLSLPQKVKGQYWISDYDELGVKRSLISIEAVGGVWTVKSNKNASVLDTDKRVIDSTVLNESSFINVKINDSNENAIIFAEDTDISRRTFRKYVITEPAKIKIGRSSSNNFCYDNRFVSNKHAELTYDGQNWVLEDLDSTNGTYVNSFRVKKCQLHAGDSIFIMGLKIVVGANYVATNNPDELLIFNNCPYLLDFIPQKIEVNNVVPGLNDKKYFFRQPRFQKKIEQESITIDNPPQPEKMETVPMALMLGPSLTMGMTSVTTAMFSVSNTISSGGDITQTMPTIIMSVSMLLGTVLWPILTKKYENRQKIKNEQRRQEKYMAYLESIRDEIKRISKEQADILHESIVSPHECALRVENISDTLWERTNRHSDFLELRLGTGVLPMALEVKCQEKKFSMENDNLQSAMFALGTEPKVLNDVPVSVSLIENSIIGVYGNYGSRMNTVKSFILQVMALHGYDEVKIMLITDEKEEREWNFVKFIPHFWSDDKKVRFLACSENEAKDLSVYIENNILNKIEVDTSQKKIYKPHHIIITSSKKNSEKCEALQKLIKLEGGEGYSILQLAEELKDLSKETKMVVSVDEDKCRIFDRDDVTGRGIAFVPDKINEIDFMSLSKMLANIELESDEDAFSLPSMLTFLEMFNVGKIEHLNSLTRWKENNPTNTLQTPIGVDLHGETFSLDLHEKFHGPHGLVAGMTGSGKSEFIITYILSLAVNFHPDEVAFILIDYKGGGLTGAFEDSDKGIKLPHLAGTITNLDGAAVKRSLISIQSELRRRQAIFNEARKKSNEGTMDIYKYQKLYREKVVDEAVPHLFIISDEFAELKSQQPEFMEQLISAARIGRSLGVHLILATQKPNGVVDDQIWSNSKFRVCLKVQEKADSQDMIKCPDAAELTQTGRFYLQVGFNELFMLGQSAWCGAEYIPSEAITKTYDSSVQVVDNLGRVVMNIKSSKKATKGKRAKQIVSIVKYLSDLAVEENINVRPLWLDPISPMIYLEDIIKKYNVKTGGRILNPVVGEYDDPFNQKQDVLTIPLTEEGNCLVYGASGNGKNTFLTTLAYYLINYHSVDEVNLYMLDYGAETLKNFEKAPHVGGVVLTADEEKTFSLFRMLKDEITNRRVLFSEYGGDYQTYCATSGSTLPNIVVIINNFAGFAELYEDLQEELVVLTRDCTKLGIYFIISSSSTSAIRYKLQQNFKLMLTMQLNDAMDYSMIVGKTDGLVPTNCKGRGLINMGRVFEFQTAYCCEADKVQNHVKEVAKELASKSTIRAKRIPVLPTVVSKEYALEYMTGLDYVPCGVFKNSLELATINLQNKVIYPISAQNMEVTKSFVTTFTNLLHAVSKVTLVDTMRLLSAGATDCDKVSGDFENFVVSIFNEMVHRHNTYVDSEFDESVLSDFEERVYVVIGVKRLFEQLSDDGKDKLSVLLDNAHAEYKLHFVFVDTSLSFNGYSYESWYKQHMENSDGLWIGDGVVDQYTFKINKITSDLYEEVENDFGYAISKGKPSLVKILSDREVEE